MPTVASFLRPRAVRLAAVAAALPILGVLILGAFPWDLLREAAQDRIRNTIGAPATIGSLKRVELWSLSPTLAIRNVRVDQPGWTGGGELLHLETADVKFSAARALLGRMRVKAVDVDGMRLNLVRDEDGRKSWTREQSGEQKGNGNGGPPALRRLNIRNAVVSYDDALRDRRFTARVSADETQGVAVAGKGAIHGEPVDIVARGAPVNNETAGKPWRFRAEIIGEAVGFALRGEMRAPLDVGHFTAAATAHGDNLAFIDAIIEAGLPETQPVKLGANVRHDAPDWEVTDLSGTIGRSDITGHALIRKREGRTRIDGVASAKQFDFEDLSSDEGLRKAAEKRRRYGKRLFPDTAIELDNVDDTDGVLQVSIEELLWDGHSPFRSVRGALTVDHQLLTIEPLKVGLAHGVMSGRIVVDERDGETKLDIDIAAREGRFADFFPGSGIDGPFTGDMRLAGPGKSVRAAIGRSSGSVAFVTQGGVIPAKTAFLLGQDVGRGLIAGDKKQATLNCVVVRLDVEDGKARPAPVVIDTSRAVTRAYGSIDFSSEELALALKGSPKEGSVLRFDGAVPVRGTIKNPDVSLPDQANSVGEILEMLGQAIVGDEEPRAGAADCDRLAAGALR